MITNSFNFGKVNVFASIRNGKIPTLTLWMNCKLHRYNIITIIIIFSSWSDVKFKNVKIRSTAEKVELLVFKTNISFATHSMQFYFLIYSRQWEFLQVLSGKSFATVSGFMLILTTTGFNAPNLRAKFYVQCTGMYCLL